MVQFQVKLCKGGDHSLGKDIPQVQSKSMHQDIAAWQSCNGINFYKYNHGRTQREEKWRSFIDILLWLLSFLIYYYQLTNNLILNCNSAWLINR